jgi:hypothetical protein
MNLGASEKKALGEDDIQSLHCSCRSESLRLFHQLARFGGDASRQTFAEILDRELSQKFAQGGNSVLLKRLFGIGPSTKQNEFLLFQKCVDNLVKDRFCYFVCIAISGKICKMNSTQKCIVI